MRGTWVASVCLLAVLPLAAQLGPKDGLNLPPVDLERVKVGTSAPDFRLHSADGQAVSLSDYRGKTVVLVFYRGYW